MANNKTDRPTAADYAASIRKVNTEATALAECQRELTRITKERDRTRAELQKALDVMERLERDLSELEKG